MRDLQPWALPASIALLAGSVLAGAFLIAVPLQGIAQRPLTIEVNGNLDLGGNLSLESMFGLGR